MKTPLQRIYRGAIVLVIVFLLAVCGYRVLGGYDWMAAVWMVVITISTVGYGERSTFTPVMQVYTVFVILFGISAAAYTFGGLIQMMLEGEVERAIGIRRMNQEIQRLKNHVIICGFGRMGRQLADELHSKNRPVVVIDSDADTAQDCSSRQMICVTGDATEEEVLISAGVERAGTLVISLPNDAESVFITLTARNLNDTLQIIARAELQSTEKKLRQAGANRIVMPAVVGARQMARMITRPSTADLMELASENDFVDLELDEIEVPDNSRLVGASVQETEAHKKHKLLIIAIKHDSGQLTFNPSATDRLQPRDTLILMGHAEDIQSFCIEYGIQNSVLADK